MNILFFLHSFNIGGAEKRCSIIANYLAKKNHKIVIALLDSPKILFEIEDNIDIYYLPENSQPIKLCNDVKANQKFIDKHELTDSRSKEHIRQNKDGLSDKELLNIIETYSKRIYSFCKDYSDYIVVSWVSLYSISCADALQNLPNKFVFVECNSPADEFPKDHYFNYLKTNLYQRSQGAIFQTDEEKNFYAYLKKQKKFVIPNPVVNLKLQRFVGERKKVIVSFGRLKKVKRIPFLIDAFSIFLKDFPNYQLHIFGDGPEKNAIKQYIDFLGLSNSILLFDSDINVHSKIYDCAMYVSTSVFEGMSNSMLEAMSIGLPTICTDCHGGGAKEIIKNGENGLIVPIDDVNELYLAMKKLVNDKKLSNKLSANSVKINDYMSVDKICDLWENALGSI